MAAGEGDEVAQAVLLAPGDAGMSLSAGLVCVPARGKELPNGVDVDVNNTFRGLSVDRPSAHRLRRA